MTKKVRCADCGFLALRQRQPRELVEADTGLRTWDRTVLSLNGYDGTPICFAMAEDLTKAIQARMVHGQDIDVCTELIVNGERDCASFRLYRIGHSPKEHMVMVDREREQSRHDERLERDRQQRWRERVSDRIWQVAMLLIGAAFGYFLRK